MAIRIDTERHIDAASQYELEKTITTTGVISTDGFEQYHHNVELPISQGKRTVTLVRTPEGMEATEKSIYYDSELDSEGNLSGFEDIRRVLLISPGDSFTTTYDIISIGKPKERVTTTFTVFDSEVSIKSAA